MYSYQSSDTICRLIEYLNKNEIVPEQVEIYGIYLNKEIPLEKRYCLSDDGKWLRRPALCKSLEIIIPPAKDIETIKAREKEKGYDWWFKYKSLTN